MANIETSLTGTVLTIRMNRPEKKNALTRAMYTEMRAALLGAAENNEVNSILFLGTTSDFSSGNDLLDFIEHPPEDETSPVFQFLFALADFPKPVVAGVTGYAVGIGTTMCMYCDGVIASDSAKFKMPFATLGLVPEAGSSLLLPGWVGMQRASEWLMLGETITLAAAQAAGLVNRVVPDADLEAAARAYAERYAALPKAAAASSKALIRGHAKSAVRQAMLDEGKVFAAHLRSDETRAILMAKMQKRG
jgi:enoyl-CoA hydratase/carnithine racemase